MRVISAGPARFEVDEAGAGEPVLLIPTALTADELVPLATRLGSGFRTINFRRRGYGASTPVTGAGSITRDASDCRALLDALNVPTAHVVGVSYSAAVALRLAADAPVMVHSLTLLEPPPVHVGSAGEFRSACERLMQISRDHGPDVALEEFLSMLVGPRWRVTSERDLPGSVAQMAHDARTFFETDLPAVLAWTFSPEDVLRVSCPVLHVGGTASGPWFAEVRRLVLDWFPHAEDVVIDGADHSLAITHADQVAGAVVPFLRRHPIES